VAVTGRACPETVRVVDGLGKCLHIRIGHLYPPQKMVGAGKLPPRLSTDQFKGWWKIPYPHMPMPKDDVNRMIKAMMPTNHLSSMFILTSFFNMRYRF
jgi:hypothetical protein